MTRTAFSRLVATTALILAAAAPASSQPSNTAPSPGSTGQVGSLMPEALYQGWRSRQLIGEKVTGKDGNEIGAVRDLVIDADGRLAALIVEGGGVLGIPEAVYRIPWANVDRTPGHAGIRVDLSSGERPQYGLFPGSEGVPTLPREFRVTEVIGDYARLQSGYGYGTVSDVVFSPDGRMIAVLVSRDTPGGGGTFAFPYRGTTGRWDPAMSYYGLPFVTDNQAREAGLRIDAKPFQSSVL